MSEERFQAVVSTVDMDERNTNAVMILIRENARILDSIMDSLVRIEKLLTELAGKNDSECLGD